MLLPKLAPKTVTKLWVLGGMFAGFTAEIVGRSWVLGFGV